jgi:hypothetical protein
MNFDNKREQRIFLRRAGKFKKRTEHILNDENSKDHTTSDKLKTYTKMP